MDLRLAKAMLTPLARRQVENGAVKIDDRELPLEQKTRKVFEGGSLNFRVQVKQSRQSFEYLNGSSVWLHPCFRAQDAFLDFCAERRQNHP